MQLYTHVALTRAARQCLRNARWRSGTAALLCVCSRGFLGELMSARNIHPLSRPHTNAVSLCDTLYSNMQAANSLHAQEDMECVVYTTHLCCRGCTVLQAAVRGVISAVAARGGGNQPAEFIATRRTWSPHTALSVATYEDIATPPVALQSNGAGTGCDLVASTV